MYNSGGDRDEGKSNQVSSFIIFLLTLTYRDVEMQIQVAERTGIRSIKSRRVVETEHMRSVKKMALLSFHMHCHALPQWILI